MFTGFEILFLAFSGAGAAGIASTRNVSRGAFAPTQYQEYEEEPQIQLARQRPQPHAPSYEGGEIHVKRKGGHFFVQCTIADVAFDAIVDSGASTCVISHKVMRALDIEPRSIRNWNSTYDTANGSVRGMAVPLDLTVMGIERSGIYCTVLESDIGNGPLANIIGMSFISTLSRCDLRGDTLIMAA